MNEPLVVILMGSKADADHGHKIADAARAFGLEVVVRIGSAHKTPEHVLALLREYEADPRAKVYVTIAGRSNALSGFVDGAVTSPVIACPPPSDAFGGMDLLSSLRMPSAIARDTGWLTAPCPAMTSAGTPSTCVFASLL